MLFKMAKKLFIQVVIKAIFSLKGFIIFLLFGNFIHELCIHIISPNPPPHKIPPMLSNTLSNS